MRANITRAITSLLCVVIGFYMTLQSQTKVVQPDFAYPQKVSVNAEKQLKKSLRSGNDIMALRSLIDYSLAQSNITVQNLPQILELMDKTMPELSDAGSRSLLYLLKARIYKNIYNDNKWKYNNRELPLTPLSTDYTEWSGAQFRHVISQLCDSAMIYTTELQQIPITEYSDIVTADKETLTYFPTLYDFVANECICLRKDLSYFSNVFSITVLTPYRIFSLQPIYVPTSAEAQKILEIYANLLRFHANDPAPLIHTDLSRIDFITDGIYSTMSDNAERKKYDLQLELYRQYADSQYSGDILLQMDADSDNPKQTAERYGLMREFIGRFPGFSRLNCIKNELMSMSQPRVSLFSPTQFTRPTDDFKVTITSRNATSVKVNLYKIDDSDIPFYVSYSFDRKSKPTLVSTQTIKFDHNIPFKADSTVTISIPSYGYYIVMPECEGIKHDRYRQYSAILCSDITLGKRSANSYDIFVADASTGAPVEGADIIFRKSSKKNSILGNTDSEGFFKIDTNAQLYGLVYASMPGKRNSQPDYISHYSSVGNQYEWDIDACILTDLPIYRPSDTVRWNAIVYEISGSRHRLAADRNLEVKMFNANMTAVDTLNLTTDSFGRINGHFVIPQGELTGQYSICINEHNDDEFCREWFTVSDYKMPTYFVELTSVLQSTPTEGDVTLIGKVRTYSGMPMSGVPLRLNLSVSQRPWWRASNSIDFYNTSDTTDASGEFKIELSKDIFANSPAPDGAFTATIQATSNNGESHEAKRTFTLGKAYELNVSMPENIDITHPVKLKLTVNSSDGKAIDTIVDYRIQNAADSIVLRSSLRSSDPTIDLSSLTSGQYDFVFSLSEINADSVVCDYITVYRPDDKMPPMTGIYYPFWTPLDKSTVTIGANRTADILYGTSAPLQYILYTLCDEDNQIIDQRWISNKAGMHHLKVKLPENINNASVHLNATSNFKASNATILIKTPDSDHSIRIVAESFRNRIIPGTEESWTFRTVDQDSTGVSAAMILDMYNSALDALTHNISWKFRPVNGYVPSMYISFPRIIGSSFRYNLTPSTTYMRCSEIQDPAFEFYGMYNAFSRNSRFYRTLSGTVNGVSATSSNQIYGARAPMAQAKQMETSVVTEEAYDEIVNAEMHSDSGLSLNETIVTGYGAKSANPETSGQSLPTFEYRENETALALYQPTLNTDADGRLSLTYRVPNANTTWRLRALAYDKNLLTDLFSADIIANKPIMVQPNMPRFIRTGDTMTIQASVMNNSETGQIITTITELFNPSTGDVIMRRDTVMQIAAGASAPVAITFQAPDTPFIGYRIKSSTDTFADGEQSLISVLQSYTPVIETQPFYISPDSTDFSMTIAQQGRDARVTLQLCDNPTWYVITALPGLRKAVMSTPQQAADAIFSAAVAEGILRDQPAVRDALRQWTSSDGSDSTLVSMLQRNNDLKTLLLQATPWMMDAASDTERMQRLALLFDTDEIRSTYTNAIALLNKLMRDDGGWAWIDQCTEASQWATYTTLYTLGRLNATGYMPDNKQLSSMITKALVWHQSEVEKEYARYPKGSYMSYLVLRDLWPAHKPSLRGQSIMASEIQKIVKKWKSFSVASKAQAIGLLKRHGYPTLARTVLSSLMEFAISSPEKGLWWPSVDDNYGGSMTQLAIAADALEAIHSLEPQSKDIDRIRQWLILQKEARNWGSSATTTQIIATILSTSSKWITPAQPLTATIGSNPVNTSTTDNLTGYFRTDISDLNPSGATLHIHKSDLTPAWGAVFSQSTQIMTDIKSSACEAVDIEKRLYMQTGSTWTEISGDSDIKIGDRIKIQLLIHATRDMQYMAITDQRPACLEPVEQLPRPVYSEGICFYRENLDSETRMFVTNMPRGTYMLEYELWVNNAGTFSSGIATIQSQYAPQLSAHSAGQLFNIVP